MRGKLDKICADVEKKIGIKPIFFSSFSKNSLEKLSAALFNESGKTND